MKPLQLPLPLFQSEWLPGQLEKVCKTARLRRQKGKETRKKRVG
jgi:hypothetical protein